MFMTAAERRIAERNQVRTREHLDRIDAHLRAWIGVDFALLGRDLGVAVDLLRGRARQLGLEPRAI